MSSVVNQVHDKFKSFVGTDIGAISDSIATFSAEYGLAAKSIGIVHVNSANELLFSLGYRDDEPGYPVALRAAWLGHIDTLHASGLDGLDQALADAAAGFEGIICHERVVDSNGDFTAVFLIHTN